MRLRAIWMTNHFPQCFDTVGWVTEHVKIIIVFERMYNVSGGTLKLTQLTVEEYAWNFARNSAVN